jgi:predicted nucleotidyltransferase
MGRIDLPEVWRADLVAWARRTNAVAELWLFGSRAKGTFRPESDVDIAVTLMPALGDHDWALGDYVALAKDWQSELEAIVGLPVSFGAIQPDTALDREVRTTGVLLWCRPNPPA